MGPHCCQLHWLYVIRGARSSMAESLRHHTSLVLRVLGLMAASCEPPTRADTAEERPLTMGLGAPIGALPLGPPMSMPELQLQRLLPHLWAASRAARALLRRTPRPFHWFEEVRLLHERIDDEDDEVLAQSGC